eukprot:9468465-Pyramimonas_sp.AAC.1
MLSAPRTGAGRDSAAAGLCLAPEAAICSKGTIWLRGRTTATRSGLRSYPLGKPKGTDTATPRTSPRERSDQSV